MDQPQPCTKCNNLPEDILMLACSHDLCLNCAADRLNFEMKKRKPANVINLIIMYFLFLEYCLLILLLTYTIRWLKYFIIIETYSFTTKSCRKKLY
jgi:hypothetical protein